MSYGIQYNNRNATRNNYWQKPAENIEIHISAWFFLSLAMLIMLLPIYWVVAVLLAALIHEIFHALAVLCLGGRIEGFYVGGRGAVLITESMSGIRECICAFAGPLGSFLLILLSKWFPRLAVCGLVHGLYNLLPLFPFDGGRILRGLLFSILSPPTATKLFRISQRCFLILLSIVSVALSIKIGVLPLLLLVFLLLKTRTENSLAKKRDWRYNSSTIFKGVRYDRITATDSPDCSKTGPLYRRRV